jgi:hypothetical protein
MVFAQVLQDVFPRSPFPSVVLIVGWGHSTPLKEKGEYQNSTLSRRGIGNQIPSRHSLDQSAVHAVDLPL